jgi:3-oxoacyl-[acyl-carrier-protein] synthase II
MTIPNMDGVVRVMQQALRDAEIAPGDVDYISAHGTGTPANDRTECAAIRTVFGSHTDHMPVSSIKSMLGHTMGAASALEAIACVLALHHGSVPPTINLESQDPECNIDCVPNQSRNQNVKVALNNSFAFGGNNACVAFSKSDVKQY